MKVKEVDNTISDSEWDVMRIIWTLGQASSTEVIDELQQRKSWSESTIKTLIRRLVNKGLLESKKDGRRFIYSATVNQTEMMVEAADALLNRMCDMHKGEVILQLLNKAPISKSDLEKMEKVISNKEKDAPKMVPCNCLNDKQKFC